MGPLPEALVAGSALSRPGRKGAGRESTLLTTALASVFRRRRSPRFRRLGAM